MQFDRSISISSLLLFSFLLGLSCDAQEVHSFCIYLCFSLRCFLLSGLQFKGACMLGICYQYSNCKQSALSLSVYMLYRLFLYRCICFIGYLFIGVYALSVFIFIGIYLFVRYSLAVYSLCRVFFVQILYICRRSKKKVIGLKLGKRLYSLIINKIYL